MPLHPLAGQPAPADLLIDCEELKNAYFSRQPDIGDPAQMVSFGTSGHRGSPLEGTFTEAHILAITQAICDYRSSNKISGPLFMGKDSHASSSPAQRTALEVLAANEVETFIQTNDGLTPTPVISQAILVYNQGRRDHCADGVVITPSHNPPADGGFKYNPPHGGPADTDVTTWIQDRANVFLRDRNQLVKRVPYELAIKADTTHKQDFVMPYVRRLSEAIDMEAIRSSGLRVAIDPLGGSSLEYWEPVKEVFGIDLTIVNPQVDATFRFMPLDHDGRIRMDCSSPYAMANLVKLKDLYDLAFGNDPDADRHGIVTPSVGLMNPNHYLAVAIDYLLSHRPQWTSDLAVGKTLVSSSLIDRVVHGRGRTLCEVPVGFKYFAAGLLDGSYCFGGEESAGASFLRRNGSVWTTDKDGLLLGLLAAEITALTGKDPGEKFQELTQSYGTPYYRRIDAPASSEQKKILKRLSPSDIQATKLAGEPILAKLTKAPGNQADIGGLKVVTKNGWFAARPSGTENIYKLYAESFKSQTHLEDIIEQAQQIVQWTFKNA